MVSMQETTHDKNRINICIICYRKGKRSLFGKEIESTIKFLFEDYEIKNLLVFLLEFVKDVTYY